MCYRCLVRLIQVSWAFWGPHGMAGEATPPPRLHYTRLRLFGKSPISTQNMPIRDTGFLQSLWPFGQEITRALAKSLQCQVDLGSLPSKRCSTGRQFYTDPGFRLLEQIAVFLVPAPAWDLSINDSVSKSDGQSLRNVCRLERDNMASLPSFGENCIQVPLPFSFSFCFSACFSCSWHVIWSGGILATTDSFCLLHRCFILMFLIYLRASTGLALNGIPVCLSNSRCLLQSCEHFSCLLFSVSGPGDPWLRH